MSEELKPCPFCGGEAKFVKISDEIVPGRKLVAWNVKCSRCFAAPLPNNYEGSKEAAAERWNRRTERTCQIVVSVDRSPASYGGRVHRCSACGKALPGALFRNGWTQLDYCPRCGARVTEVVRDAD